MADDELANNSNGVFTKSNVFSSLFFHGFLLAMAFALLPILVPATNIQVGKYINKNLYQAIQIALDFFMHNQGQV